MAKRKPIDLSEFDNLDNFNLNEDYQEKEPAKAGRKPSLLFYVTVVLAVITTVTVSASAAIVYTYMTNLISSRRERATLLELSDSPYVSAFDTEMRQINPDYICWITIDGTVVDYPVVRGNDNEKYLNMSFYGAENKFGALFMDYRCTGEYVPHIIIYGHNSREGEMFGGLRKFLDGQYLAERPIITLTVNDRIVEYEIFSARQTDVNDPAYFLDFRTSESFYHFAERCGAPPDAAQIITLSTCVSGDDDDERIIIQGALRNNKQ